MIKKRDKMHGYYIDIEKSEREKQSGIGKKIDNQIEVFNNEGLNFTKLVLPFYKSRYLSVLYRIPFCNVLPIWKYHKEFDDANFIYMRRPFVMNYFMRKTLRQIKIRNPKIKIVVEIPTYPYDDEYNRYKIKNLFLWNDKYNRNKMQGLIDYYATLTDDKEIFNIPTLQIKNGVDLTVIPKKNNLMIKDNTIHLCAVAMFKEWHGYERLLYGLQEYYQNGGTRRIVCHFIGEGSELPQYKKIASSEGISDNVIFHGFLTGERLNYIYDISSIALGVFGMYKKNVNLSCDLKSREAVARGIPMVTGCPTDIFCKDYKYFYEFPNDDSVLDIQEIINFHDKIYNDESVFEVIENIREYAIKTVDIKTSMNKVVDFFKTEIRLE